MTRRVQRLGSVPLAEKIGEALAERSRRLNPTTVRLVRLMTRSNWVGAWALMMSVAFRSTK